MSDDQGPKSSFELAMERLRRKDAEEGTTVRSMTEQQKSAIAEVRSLYDSRIAEQEILQQAAIRNLQGAEPAVVEEVTRRFRSEKERLASERDTRVERIRQGEG